jgi:hypothetical protein
MGLASLEFGWFCFYFLGKVGLLFVSGTTDLSLLRKEGFIVGLFLSCTTEIGFTCVGC